MFKDTDVVDKDADFELGLIGDDTYRFVTMIML